jgi:hypothetical protein
MEDTTVNLEREELESSGYYVWEVAEKHVSIELSYDVVDRLLAEVMKGFGVVPRRGAEVGGILLGSAVLSDRLTVRIDDFELVPTEYSRGPSYLLSANDRSALEAALERWAPEPDRPIYTVGFFRSHTREGLFLSPEDLELFANCFPNPTDVALLVKPFVTRLSVAGFFFREGDAIRHDSSYMEFPFRRRELGGGSRSPSRSREDLEQDRGVAAVPAGNGDSAPVNPAAADSPPAAASERPLFSSLVEPPKLKRGNVWIPLSFIFLILGILLGFQAALTTRNKNPAPAEDPYFLNLQAKKAGDTLLLKWDRNAPVLRKARRAVLTIADGQYNNTVNIEPADLQSGNLYYRNMSNLVRFRLEVYTGDRSSFAESLEFQAEGRTAPK